MSAVVQLRENCARIVELRDKLRENAEAHRLAKAENERAQLCLWNIESERIEIERQLEFLESQI